MLVLAGAQAVAIKATIDPSELAAGSRPLGMGRAYVGVADDIYAVYQNAAGLSYTRNWQVASMYSSLLSLVDYRLLGFSSSMSREAVGISYINAAISGSQVTKRDPVTDRIVPDGDQAISYTSSVWFLTYALQPSKYFSHPFFKNMSLGVNFKIFDQALNGIPTVGAYNAMGTDLDVGWQYRPSSWLTLGAAGYNVLPYDMGGRLMWQSGINESIPASAKLGFAAKLLGKGGLRESIYFPQELTFSYDYEFTPMRTRPALNHFGLEWWPLDYFSLRFGIDQDAVAVSTNEVGTSDNLTAGIGLRFQDFGFDYAFHTFGSLTENNTHFFTISYGIPREKFPVYAPKEKMYLEITEPATKSVTFLPNIVVKGKVINPDGRVKDVRVNELSAQIFEDASFVSVVKLPRYAFNNIKVDVIGPTGRIVDSKLLRVARLVPFKDLPEGHVLRYKVGAMAALEIIKGYPDETFRPEGRITRAELATLLVRIVATKEGSALRKPFPDVALRHWAAWYIEEAVKRKMFRGYPDGTFKPKNNITRAEAITVLLNFAPVDKVHYVYEQPFPDIDISHWASKHIFLAKKYGYLDYLAGKKFDPNRKITRGEVADILSKIEPVATQVKELLE
jgi:hypothetical protein